MLSALRGSPLPQRGETGNTVAACVRAGDSGGRGYCAQAPEGMFTTHENWYSVLGSSVRFDLAPTNGSNSKLSAAMNLTLTCLTCLQSLV
jgi:hypothetical protein